MEENLILGSVVRVNIENQDYKFMIVSKDLYIEEDKKIDYAGVMYPYGYVEGMDLAYFNKETITEVNYTEEEDKATMFYDKLTKNYNEEIDAKRSLSNRD